MKVSRDMFLDHAGTLIGFVNLVTLVPVKTVGVESSLTVGVEISLVILSLSEETRVVMFSVYLFILSMFCPDIFVISFSRPFKRTPSSASLRRTSF